MILSRTPITIAEVKSHMKSMEEKKQLEEYLKFAKLSMDSVRACAQELRNLKNQKISEEHIVKLVDFMPADAEDVNKIFNDVSLTEEELHAVLAIIKKY